MCFSNLGHLNVNLLQRTEKLEDLVEILGIRFNNYLMGCL